MPNLIITHAYCMDGYAAKKIAEKFYKDSEEITYIYVNPFGLLGQLEEVFAKLQDIAMIRCFDVSMGPNELKLMMSVCSDVMVFDHHTTTYRKFTLEYGMDIPKNILIDQDESGATLAFKYYFPDSYIPAVIRYIKDRDTWTFKERDSREVNAGLYDALDPCENADQDAKWSELLNMPEEDERPWLDKMIYEGRVIINHELKQFASIIRKGAEKVVRGRKVFVVNSPIYQSDLGDFILKNHECDYIAIWRYDQISKEYTCSLRSRKTDDMDVSTVAEYYGGGGHRTAAGFATTDFSEFM